MCCCSTSRSRRSTRPLRRELSAELSQTLREWGKLAVLVTHDLPEAYQIADMVVLYEHGSTTGAVSKNDLLWNPSSERVARLIGARNILRAAIADASGDSIILDWRGGRLEAARSPSHPSTPVRAIRSPSSCAPNTCG